MKEIQLNKGLVAQVDDADYERVMAAGPWFAYRARKAYTAYALRSIKRDGKNTTQSLHRFILGVTDPMVLVDHGDRNGLNCQRLNIRVATRSQNAANAGKRAGGKSRYHGVNSAQGKFWARITIDGRRLNLGSYWHEVNAALAYDRAARFFYGAFASCNFPPAPKDRVA